MLVTPIATAKTATKRQNKFIGATVFPTLGPNTQAMRRGILEAFLTGHKTLTEVQRYVDAADKARLAEQAIAKLRKAR